MPFYYGCDVLISYPTTSQERFLFTNISGFFYRDGGIRVGSKAWEPSERVSKPLF